MDFKENKYKLVSLNLIGVILIFILSSLFSTYGGKKFLKRLINKNNDKIELLDKAQNPLFEQGKKDSVVIVSKNKIIRLLKIEQKRILIDLKNIQNENDSLKNNYLNNTINKRVDLFSRLTLEN